MGAEREGLALAGVTARAPSPPLVIPADADPAPVLRALSAAWGAPSTDQVRLALRLEGFVPVTETNYRQLAPFAPEA